MTVGPGCVVRCWQLVTKDLIRKIRVPREKDPQTVTISQDKFREITGAAEVRAAQRPRVSAQEPPA